MTTDQGKVELLLRGMIKTAPSQSFVGLGGLLSPEGPGAGSCSMSELCEKDFVFNKQPLAAGCLHVSEQQRGTVAVAAAVPLLVRSSEAALHVLWLL